MKDERPKLDKEDIQKIVAALTEAYKEVGKNLETAMLVGGGDDPDEVEVLVDNRKKEDMN